VVPFQGAGRKYAGRRSHGPQIVTWRMLNGAELGGRVGRAVVHVMHVRDATCKGYARLAVPQLAF
jgi:hypothetical protein